MREKISYFISIIKYTYVDMFFVILSVLITICLAIASLLNIFVYDERNPLFLLLGLTLLYACISVVSIIIFKKAIKENRMIIEQDYTCRKTRKAIKEMKKI